MGANAQTSVPVFTAGQVLAAQQQTEINTGIPVFATTTTRDAAFGGTGEKTLAEGQFAYIEASNITQYYDGAAWQTVGGGLTLVKTQTIGSAVSSVAVTDAFSSTYDNYLITIGGGVASQENDLRLQLGATTTGYYGSCMRVNYSGTTSTESDSNQSNFQHVGRGSTNSLSFNANLFAPNLAKNTIVNSAWVGCGTTSLQANYGGFLNDTTQYTGFTILTDAGTLTGGTIRVYGYANS